MEYSVTTCPGCGSTFIQLDYARKVIICDQCGAVSPYTRTALNKNGKVVFALDNATKCFKEGQFENAARYAHDALNVSNENIPALFIIAYYEEFVLYKSGSFKKFHEKVMRDMMIEGDEMVTLMELFVSAAYNLRNYEREIMDLVRINMASPGDAARLCEFVDKLCPYFIDKRGSCIYLEEEMFEIYKALAQHCNIPKTCYALLKSIGTNPDSPYVIRQKEAASRASADAAAKAKADSEAENRARAEAQARYLDEAMIKAKEKAKAEIYERALTAAKAKAKADAEGRIIAEGLAEDEAKNVMDEAMLRAEIDARDAADKEFARSESIIEAQNQAAVQEQAKAKVEANMDVLDNRVAFFYQHYVLPVGHIINSMSSPDLKNKLMPAYQKVNFQYRKDNGMN